MSGTDSDLEFESADEDADFGVHTKNNNTPSKNRHPETNSKEPAISEESRENNVFATESCKASINVDNEKNVTNDTDSNIKTKISDISSVKNTCEGERVSDEKQVEFKEKRDFESSMNDDNKIQEKQRVTLRLEKKIQQKQMSKDSSVDKESSAISTEITQKQNEVKSSSWGFSTWGTNLFSSAASSVSTFTNQVSQGIGTVLETVENTLGVPPAEELAATVSKGNESSSSPTDKTEDENLGAEETDETKNKSSILPNVSSWTKVLEDTGSKVLMGGLDTLELIGKKTINIITESDPGLRKTRSVFGDGTTLSQILREAKAEADESKQDADSQGLETIHYSQMFDEYQGLVHLEALEMLSKQSQVKMHRLLMRVARNAEIRKNIEEIKSICENIPPIDDPTECENFEDFDTVCKKYILELSVPFKVENFIKTQKRITEVVKSYETATATTSTPEEIYHSAICSLAEFTAKSIETFHKLAELILVQTNLEPSVEHFAINLTGLATVTCIEINNLSLRYHRCLDSIAEQSEDGSSIKSNVTSTVTNLYVEASNSNKYIQDAFLLLVPVLQVSQLETAQ